MKLTNQEHSIILYLLDAIQSAPNKRDYLVNIATDRIPYSNDFGKICNQLKDCDINNIKEICSKIRLEIK